MICLFIAWLLSVTSSAYICFSSCRSTPFSTSFSFFDWGHVCVCVRVHVWTLPLCWMSKTSPVLHHQRHNIVFYPLWFWRWMEKGFHCQYSLVDYPRFPLPPPLSTLKVLFAPCTASAVYLGVSASAHPPRMQVLSGHKDVWVWSTVTLWLFYARTNPGQTFYFPLPRGWWWWSSSAPLSPLCPWLSFGAE